MKALLEDMKSGEVAMYEVPAPELTRGCVLVHTAFSAISAGTEKVKIESGQKSLLGKAMARPDLVKQVIDRARANGIKTAWQKVRARLDSLSTLGYSCSGYVIEAGEDVTEFRPGDRVACAGAGYANHCEINVVPKNLVARVPDNVGLDAAALTTIGAIAMQGVRQANVTFGETVVVIGAGLVGILAIQILRAAGCRVIAIDLSQERAKRAATLGAHLGLSSADPGMESAICAFSRYGVDATIITAATKSAEPVELAAKLLRDRGRITIVGDVGMGVSRGNMYMKELSLLMSRSYGPGRYDPEYEEEGHDYPIGYVRWTEKRNMEAFLDLLSCGTINVKPLLEHHYPVESGGKAYSDLTTGIYTGIIDYHAPSGPVSIARPTVAIQAPQPRASGTVKIGCLGAGSFARGIIFPHLRAIKQVTFESVATNSGVAAESARKGFGFHVAETPAALLANPNVDMAFVLTRHDSHASYVCSALEQGKAVFVEKPLAIDQEQLDEIKAIYERVIAQGKSPFLMVGFNRRFAPLTRKLCNFFQDRSEPMMIHVRCNAGFIPRNSWIQNGKDGGRIVGELCHFVDWARAVANKPVTSVVAAALPDGGKYNRDNVSLIISFEDGSIANLIYIANGDRSVSKEYFEVFCQGKIARLDDFKALHLSYKGRTESFKSAQDKGHRKEMELTVEAFLQGKEPPIPFQELVEVTETTFAAHRAIRTNAIIPLKTANTSQNKQINEQIELTEHLQ